MSDNITMEELSDAVAEATDRRLAGLGGQDASPRSKADVRTAAFAEGVRQERERISAIVRSDHARGRRALALKIALDTDLTPEQAQAVLSSAPREAQAIGTRAQKAEPVPAKTSGWDAVIAQVSREFGVKPRR
jgi:hypothetical protein